MRIVLVLFGATLLLAGDKWMRSDYHSWTPQQAQQLLASSPWAVVARATVITQKEKPGDREIPLPQPANAPQQHTYTSDSYGVDDGKWDGGVGRLNRGDPPTVPVTVRWDSAQPVREALLLTHAPELQDTEHTLAQDDKDYIVAVSGLAPAKPAPRQDEDGNEIAPPPYDENGIRQAIANTARLLRDGHKPLAPEDVRLDENTGSVEIYFPKTDPIELSDKDVVFRASYGSLQVVQRFRLKDMVVNGKLTL